MMYNTVKHLGLFLAPEHLELPFLKAKMIWNQVTPELDNFAPFKGLTILLALIF